MKRTALLMAVWGATVRICQGDAAQSGGEGTVRNAGRDAFSLPITNRSNETKRLFVIGNSFFNENWLIAPASAQARDGLGPLFNARSCSSCHVKDGRGAMPANENDTPVALLIRLSVPGTGEHGAPRPDPVYGGQLAVRALPGAEPEATVSIRWTEVPGEFADSEKYSLRRPEAKLSDWRYGTPSADLLTSLRLAPGSFGGGLLEAVPEAAIAALADPDDRDSDGISGRMNRVWSAARNAELPGRFGWKANAATLRDQAAIAFHEDIGITTTVLPAAPFTAAQAEKLSRFPDGGPPEVDDKILDRVTVYLQALGVPARRDLNDPVVQKGEALFRTARCALCHLPELKTGDDAATLKELRSQTIRPFTDLLLHDMGPDLADNRPDFLATGSEWRTPPLWGLGLHTAVNGSTAMLHDGRARTPAEAILWHGGEAQPSREAFRQMSRDDRAALVRFLESL